MTAIDARRPERHANPLDMDAILAPIAGGDGGGDDIRYSGDHDRIREARRQDRDLPQGVWQTDLKRANWDEVARLCQTTLATRSKDLQVAAWLVEALVFRDGFAGLHAGLEMMLALCRSFWPVLHPAIDTVQGGDEEGLPDYEARLAPLAWLNDKLPPAVFSLPITRSGSITVESYSWADFKQAERLEIIRQKTPRLPADSVDLATFHASAMATPPEVSAEILHWLSASADLLDRLDDDLAAFCGRQAPSLVTLKTAITDIRDWLATQAPSWETAPLPADDEPRPKPEPAAAIHGDGPIASRDDAYRRLSQIADYLLRTEPHSPAPYLLRRVVAWGRMPLHQLLVDMSSGRNDLAAILELLGDHGR